MKFGTSKREGLALTWCLEQKRQLGLHRPPLLNFDSKAVLVAPCAVDARRGQACTKKLTVFVHVCWQLCKESVASLPEVWYHVTILICILLVSGKVLVKAENREVRDTNTLVVLPIELQLTAISQVHKLVVAHLRWECTSLRTLQYFQILVFFIFSVFSLHSQANCEGKVLTDNINSLLQTERRSTRVYHLKLSSVEFQTFKASHSSVGSDYSQFNGWTQSSQCLNMVLSILGHDFANLETVCKSCTQILIILNVAKMIGLDSATHWKWFRFLIWVMSLIPGHGNLNYWLWFNKSTHYSILACNVQAFGTFSNPFWFNL